MPPEDQVQEEVTPEITPDSIPEQPADEGEFDPVAEMTRAFQDAGYDANNVDLKDAQALEENSEPVQRDIVPGDDGPQTEPESRQTPEPQESQHTAGEEGEPQDGEGILDYIRTEFGDDEAKRLSEKYNGDEAEILKGLVNAQKLVGRRDDDAKFGQQLKQWGPQFSQFLAQQNQGQVPPPQAAQPPLNPYLPPPQPQYPGQPAYYPQAPPQGYGQLPPQHQVPNNTPGVQGVEHQRPRFDPRWREELRVNPETNEVEGPQDMVQAYRDYQRYEKERSQKLLEDGLTREEAVGLIRQEAQQIANEQMQRQWAQYREESTAKDFLESNKDWMFEGGEYRLNGGQLQGQLSESGQRFTQHYMNAAAEANYYNIPQEHRSNWAQETAMARMQADTARWIMSQGNQQPQNQATPNAQQVQHKPPQQPKTNHAPMVHQPSVTRQPPGEQIIREGETMDQALMRQIREASGGDMPSSVDELLAAEMQPALPSGVA